MDEELKDALISAANNEAMFHQIVVWLRAKGLWEECLKDLVTKVKETSDERLSRRTNQEAG